MDGRRLTMNDRSLSLSKADLYETMRFDRLSEQWADRLNGLWRLLEWFGVVYL